jgi:hypothetical protein
MNFIEYALIDVEAEDLAAVEDVEMDAKDRHILAASISADADILLTDNIAHFPAEWMAEHGVVLLNSAALLRRLAETFPDKLRAAHQQTVRLSRRSEAEILATLESIVGESVVGIIRALTTDPV